jgi:S-DNA-T family DNA segregation ATPase FtsK/SpoIIIE
VSTTDHDDTTGAGNGELAQVHYLPATTGTTDQTDAIDAIEGEIVSEEEYRRLTSQKAQAIARYQGYGRDIVATGRIVKTVATHDHTKTVAKAALRHTLYVPAGAVSFGKRAWESRTTARYQRLMRAAEAAGNLELLRDWEDRAEQFKDRRHRRTMDWIDVPVKLVKALVIAVGTLVCLLVGIGIVLMAAQHDASAFLEPFDTALSFVNWVVLVVTIVWGPLVLATPWVVVAALWNEGRRRGLAPSWLATASAADMDMTIDETTIATALAALRIPQVTAYLKDGLPLQYLTPARRDGRGTHAIVRLPAGVTAEKIARRRADLATGLHRLAKEVWPTTGSEAGILDLWVADKGALAEGAGPYPLLAEGTVDVFKGVPFGKTLRGDPILSPVMERNTIGGGMPGQGKSSGARVVACGVALDPTAELRIWVPDANFDFEAFRPRCSRYVMGAEDEKIEEILDHLRELHAEVQARGDLLVKYEIPAVTREYASKNVGLHPLWCLLEEAHVCIQHKKYGAEISQLLVDIVRLGRKRGIHLFVSTQAPTKDSMPRDVTRNCSNGIAFAVGDHVANDALLGQGAYAAGHRATELIPGTDKGTAVVKGFSGERSEIVQVYFVDISKSNDQVTPIIERSLALIADRGKSLPGGTKPAPVVEAARDLLDDLDEVLDTEPVKAADVPPMLRKLAPNWAPYRGLNGTSLRETLAEEGVKVPTTGNRFPIDPVTIREALAMRATADLDDDN